MASKQTPNLVQLIILSTAVHQLWTYDDQYHIWDIFGLGLKSIFIYRKNNWLMEIKKEVLQRQLQLLGRMGASPNVTSESPKRIVTTVYNLYCFVLFCISASFVQTNYISCTQGYNYRKISVCWSPLCVLGLWIFECVLDA